MKCKYTHCGAKLLPGSVVGKFGGFYLAFGHARK